MSEEEKPVKKAKTGADKATFKASEKRIQLERIPELEQAAKDADKEKKPGQPSTGPTPAPQTETPQISPEALRPTINMLAMRWNAFLEAPPGDEKAKYAWRQEDTDNLVNAMVALDEKYHFMGNWLTYMPELFAVIVIGGIVAKLVFGARWKNSQRISKPAGEAPANPEPKGPAGPTLRERIQAGVEKIVNPQPPDSSVMPPDLRQAATEYMQGTGKKAE